MKISSEVNPPSWTASGVNSDFNKEDLSEKEIFDILQKLSEDEVNKALGFWAVPLPSEDNDTPNKPRYTSKK